MTERTHVSIREKLRNAKDTILNPEKIRQTALAALYSTAVTKLRNDNPEFFPASEGHLRIDYLTKNQRKHIVITTFDVSNAGIMQEYPATIIVGGEGFAPYRNSQYWISRNNQGRYDIELVAWDGRKDNSFKSSPKRIKQLAAALDERLQGATRWYRR